MISQAAACWYQVPSQLTLLPQTCRLFLVTLQVALQLFTLRYAFYREEPFLRDITHTLLICASTVVEETTYNAHNEKPMHCPARHA